MIQEQDIHSNVQNLNDFPKKLIRAVSGASRLLAWDHFRWFVDLLIDILPVSFQVGAILWCLNFFFCCCCCFFVQNYLQTEWNHLLLACSRNHSTFPSTIVRLCESSTRERAWRGSKNNSLRSINSPAALSLFALWMIMWERTRFVGRKKTTAVPLCSR